MRLRSKRLVKGPNGPKNDFEQKKHRLISLNWFLIPSQDDFQCPFCDGMEKKGHKRSCKISKMLQKVGKN